MIDRFYTTFFQISRLIYSGDKGAGTMSQVGSMKAHIQQADNETKEQTASMFTLSHIVWCPLDTDIEIGDQIVATGTYFVRGKRENNIGANQHLELYVEQV